MTNVSTAPSYVTDAFTRWMITFSVMLVAVVEVIDVTIVNVALPNMMGSLGANSDQITWTLTSYIVSAAICMPLTGFLVKYVGRKRLLLINIGGFLISSMLCGMAISLTQMIFFRTLQGIFGATLVPMSQYILRDTFPPDEQGKAMAIWGIGIMAGPVFGPTLGGYITETLNWRWIFYINAPVCILAFIMTWKYITETPRSKPFMDWIGLGLMVIGIGSLQIFLDRGNQDSWFASHSILILALISAWCLTVFIWRGWSFPHNIIPLQLFKNAHFSIATVVLAFYCMLLFGILTLQPLMMQSLLHYSVSTTGWLMSPRGITSAISMVIVAKLMGKIDLRILIILGLLLTAAGTYISTFSSSLYMSSGYIVYSGLVQGLGMGLIFVPLATLSLSTLDPSYVAEGSGLFSFGRSLGSSVGISLLSTVLAQESQINWNRLGGFINASNPALYHWLHQHHLTLNSLLTPALLTQELYRQSTMLAFIDCYWLATLGFLAMIPLIFFLTPGKKKFTATDLGH